MSKYNFSNLSFGDLLDYNCLVLDGEGFMKNSKYDKFESTDDEISRRSIVKILITINLLAARDYIGHIKNSAEINEYNRKIYCLYCGREEDIHDNFEKDNLNDTDITLMGIYGLYYCDDCSSEGRCKPGIFKIKPWEINFKK